MRFRFLALPVAAVLLAAGCTPGNGTPTPTPTPSVSSVASPTSTPSPTLTPTEDPLIAEAERVYMAALRAQWKYELTGDYSQFPPELKEYLDDNVLAITRGVFEDNKAAGLRLVGGEPKVDLMHLPGVSKQDSIIALLVCYDTTALKVVDAAGAEVAPGRLSALTAYFHHAVDGRLKVFTQDGGDLGQCGG